MTPKDQARLLSELRPGLSVFVQGATGEVAEFARALESDPERARGLHITACLIPGVNRFDYGAVHAGSRLTTFMASDAWRASMADGRTQVPPFSYAQTALRLMAQSFDLAVFQVTPPDAQGQCSFGVSGDFAPLVWKSARRRLGFINAQMPRPPRSETIPFEALDAVFEISSPLISAPTAPVSPILETISRKTAELIADGAALQTGVGGAPGALLAHLKDHRQIVIRSGMVSDGYRLLAEAGALADGADHVTGIAYGGGDLYDWAAGANLAFSSVAETHDAAKLARHKRFTSVNSALEVDLFGQINVEWRSGAAVSGVGGAPDFARAAMMSPDGLGVVALASCAGSGGPSRILAKLSSPTVSIGRHEVDAVVTEHGVARLKGKGLDERAEALMAIADPIHRGGLEDAWRDFRRSPPRGAGSAPR